MIKKIEIKKNKDSIKKRNKMLRDKIEKKNQENDKKKKQQLREWVSYLI